MENKEWIHIGTDTKGLAAAILLGREGQQTALLEQNLKTDKKRLLLGYA